MPRRIPDYALQFAEFNAVVSIGAFIFGLSQLIFVYNLFKTVIKKQGIQATDKVWDQPEGLEWEIPSPAPYHTFTEPPIVK
jgi:cytochrome c oxidase subunit 1